MDGIIQVKVKGSYLSKDSDRGGVQGEANVTILRITFSEDWMKFEDKRITFFNALGLNPTEIKLTDELREEGVDNIYLCFIPGEAYTHDGWFSFVIDGYAEGVRKRSVEGKLECVYAPGADGIDTDEPDEFLLEPDFHVISNYEQYGAWPHGGYDGIKNIIVDTDPALTPEVLKVGTTAYGVKGAFGKFQPKSQEITTNGSYPFTPDVGYDGLSRVDVTVDVPQIKQEIIVNAKIESLPTITPTRDPINLAASNYGLDGWSHVSVAGSDDLLPSNIRKGATIFNVEGEYEKTEEIMLDVENNKTAYLTQFPFTVRHSADKDAMYAATIYSGDEDFVASNIKSGVTIFGLRGTYVGEDIKTQYKELTPPYFPYPVYPDSPNNGLHEVRLIGDPSLVPSNIANGKTIFGVTGSYESPMQELTINPSLGGGVYGVTDPKFKGISKVILNPIDLSKLDLENLDEVKF